jgi:phosphate:Na+ symporter
MAYLSTGLGGIGLFLLGMWLITEGLRLAAGPSLEQLLGRWTSSRLRGLMSGTLLTAVLQSSSAVTVAAIGFVNAGLMTFQRGVWVIFGSNLGTTLTAWIVALIGFKFKVDALALPIIGIGALLRVFAPVERYRSLGMALAGFGILFMGIEVLASGFGSLGEQIDLHDARFGLPWMILLGIVLTALMQSSSAAIAVVLSAVAAGLVGFSDAAAVVIGANVGTTSSALLATIGATSHAKRLAIAHVLFNVVTAIVALALLTPLLKLVMLIGEDAGHAGDWTTLLALFHTLFNLLGVLVMWPVEPYMSRWLLGRFVERDAEPTRLRFLDRNVASLPDAAPVALVRELEPLIVEAATSVQGLPQPDGQRRLQSQQRHRHLAAIGDFFVDATRYPISADVAGLFSRGWRIQHNLMYVEETVQRLDELATALTRSADFEQIREPVSSWFDSVEEQLKAVLGGTGGTLDFIVLAPAYEQVKLKLLQLALSGKISRGSLDTALQMCSLSRRFSEQWLRALNHWRQMREETDGSKRPEAAAEAEAAESPLVPAEASAVPAAESAGQSEQAGPTRIP